MCTNSDVWCVRHYVKSNGTVCVGFTVTVSLASLSCLHFPIIAMPDWPVVCPTSCSIGPILFLTWWHKRRPEPGFSFVGLSFAYVRFTNCCLGFFVLSLGCRRRRFWHATWDCVAPYVDIILCRGRFWAKSAASGSVIKVVVFQILLDGAEPCDAGTT